MKQNPLRRQRGSSLIEFALILPVLLLLTLGVADMGRAYSAHLALMNGAREGARYLASHPYDTTGAIQRAQLEFVDKGIPADDVTITATPGDSGQIVSVSLHYEYPLLFGFLPFSTIPLDITVSMPAI
ncbi:MAG: pilus assembly protein [Chloroflexi bacterium]|nr:pilus assembly protein [Chloroflexota bacterium]